MSQKKKDKQPEIPPRPVLPEISNPEDPPIPVTPEEDPDLIPEEDPYVEPPEELPPPPGEGP